MARLPFLEVLGFRQEVCDVEENMTLGVFERKTPLREERRQQQLRQDELECR